MSERNYVEELAEYAQPMARSMKKFGVTSASADGVSERIIAVHAMLRAMNFTPTVAAYAATMAACAEFTEKQLRDGKAEDFEGFGTFDPAVGEAAKELIRETLGEGVMSDRVFAVQANSPREAMRKAAEKLRELAGEEEDEFSSN